jgi:hypothetical protein
MKKKEMEKEAASKPLYGGLGDKQAQEGGYGDLDSAVKNGKTDQL